MVDEREGDGTPDIPGQDRLDQDQESVSRPAKVLEYLQRIPFLGGHIPLLTPPLLAAWKASEAGIKFGKILREGFEHEGALKWPDEEMAELVFAMGEVADTLPPVDQILPIISDLLEALQQWVDEGGTRPYGVLLLRQLETFGEKLLGALFDLALFTPSSITTSARSRELTRLFTHLESLFNKLITYWVGGVAASSEGDDFLSPANPRDAEDFEESEASEEQGSAS